MVKLIKGTGWEVQQPVEAPRLHIVRYGTPEASLVKDFAYAIQGLVSTYLQGELERLTQENAELKNNLELVNCQPELTNCDSYQNIPSTPHSQNFSEANNLVDMLLDHSFDALKECSSPNYCTEIQEIESIYSASVENKVLKNIEEIEKIARYNTAIPAA
jgi:L-asparaginase II